VMMLLKKKKTSPGTYPDLNVKV
jgi:hypothetical protein